MLANSTVVYLRFFGQKGFLILLLVLLGGALPAFSLSLQPGEDNPKLDETVKPEEILAGSVGAFSLGLQPRKNALKLDAKPLKAVVAAPVTPLGIYKKSVADAVGKCWYDIIKERWVLISPGEAGVAFFVDKNGRAEKVRLLSNTANAKFATLCMRSITDARIPPPPSEVLKHLKNSRLEITYHFTI